MGQSILHVVHGYPEESIGGTERHVADLVALQSQRHGVHVFHRSLHGPLEGSCDVSPLPSGTRHALFLRPRFHRGFREVWWNPRLDEPFVHCLESVRPDVVHVHHLAGLSFSYLARAKERGARLVYTVHDYFAGCARGQRRHPRRGVCTTVDPKRCAGCVHPLAKELTRGAARGAAWTEALFGLRGPDLIREGLARVVDALSLVDVIIAPSARALELIAEVVSIRHGVVIPHGLPPLATPISPPSPPVDRPLRVAHLGGATAGKGQDLLITAAKRLGPSRVHLHLHGPGPKITLPGVQWHGPYPRDELPSLLATADAVAIPSTWEETYSLVLREAWQARRPAIVARLGALADAAADDRTALGFSEGSVTSLSDALARLGDEPETFRRLTGPFSVATQATMACAIEETYRS